MLSEIQSDSIKATMQALQDFGTRYALAGNRREVAVWLRNKMISVGYTNAVIDSFMITKTIQTVFYQLYQYNIKAVLEGNLTPGIESPIYVLGAHYDSNSSLDAFHIAPGADDNASGTAAVIEIARVMKLKNFQPASTIHFVLFGVEELMGTPGSGSGSYADSARAKNKDIRMMINYDMISNASGSINRVVNVNRYDSAEWLSKLSVKIISAYTDLAILLASQTNSPSSDSWHFFKAGYPAVYFEEAQFSPVYHSPDDLLANCNTSYCAEVAKIACALLAEDVTRPVVTNISVTPEIGNLKVTWKKNTGNNVLGYNLYRSLSPGDNYEKINFTLLHDTTYTDQDVAPLTWYYYIATTINSSYEESETVSVDSSFIPTHNQGVLIVDDSKSELFNPADSVTDAFYDSLLTGYPHSHFDATNAASVDPFELGKYNMILWHTDKFTSSSKLSASRETIKKYLQYGGKLLLTTERFAKTVTQSSLSQDTYYPGDFIYDVLHIDSMYKSSSPRFSGGKSISTGYPDLYIDSLKTSSSINYHLALTEAIFPTGGDIIYSYDTKFDSASTSGLMKGMPVGIEYMGIDYKLIVLSFPLWYTRLQDAKDFINYVMLHKFNDPDQVAETAGKKNNTILFPCSPNPCSDHTNIRFYLDENTHAALEFYNTSGIRVAHPVHKEMQAGFHSMDFSTQEFTPGIYFIVLKGNGFYKTSKVVVIK